MGKIIQNLPTGNTTGKVGDLVFVHCADGRILVRRAPVRQKPFRPLELEGQSHFALGVAYVRRLKANPDAYAAYKALGRELRKRACDLAIADFLNPPHITDIDLTHY